MPTACTVEQSSTWQAVRSQLLGPLELADLFRLGQQIQSQAAQLSSPLAAFAQQRVALIGGLTLDYLARAIRCAIVQEGVIPQLYQAPFGSLVQEVLDPGSGLHRFRPEVVVVAADRRDFHFQLPISASAAEVAAAISANRQLFEQLWKVLHDGLGAKILQHTLIPPPHGFCGPAERLAAAAPVNFVRVMNDSLIEAGGGRVHWIELDRMAAEIGWRAFSAERFHNAAKLAFDPQFLPDYLPFFRAAWRGASGRAKKVLVLDLDNTLWGGVIGDDGVDGIKLGPGSSIGEAFTAWGQYLQELRARGVLLAVCSKNAPEIAASGFSHPHAALRLENFAAFECSWNDKVRGLQRIAQALNLGLDSFIFADDNPAECEIVRTHLPEVAVVPLGQDPTCFIELLERGRWFDIAAYTAEDLTRSAAYSARARAFEEELKAPDVKSYLAALKMVGRIGKPQAADMPRLAQLELKTNQFNVTTRRYSEATLGEFVHRPDAIVLAFRLADRFADHGLVSTLIGIQEADTLRIDSWLMSCRVFSRTAEEFILRQLIAMARERGVRRIVGEYRQSARNGVVADLYRRCRFRPLDVAGTFWERDIRHDGLAGLETLIADDAKAESVTAE